MTTIQTSAIKHFASKDLDLSSNLLTTSLGTVGRYNIARLFSCSSKFDSEMICSNLESAIRQNNMQLSDAEKATTLKNLNTMKVKFSKSIDISKAQNCSLTIDRIISYINPPQTVSAPVSSTSHTHRKGHKKKHAVTTGAVAPATDSKAQKMVSTVQTSTPAPHKVVAQVRATDTHGAQQKLVEAISRNNQKVETVTVTVNEFEPDMDWINGIEKDVTDDDRRAWGFKRCLKYYSHEDKYYYDAVQLMIKGGIRTHKRIRVEAKDVKKHMAQVKETGTNDIGARFREKLQKMNISFQQ